MATKPTKDKAREDRIAFEAIVDAYGPEEQAMGWYYYLQEKLTFSFTATCITEREISPLAQGDKVEVIGQAKEDECMSEMFVKIRWNQRGLAVPLSQLEPSQPVDDETKEAIADWHYWVGQGYQLC